MADVHSKQTRSYNMSRITSADTKPELLVRKNLHSKGLRYRLHVKKLPGKPDIFFPKYKTAVEVRGCFWHGHHGCKYFKLPATRTEWWKDKIKRNCERDITNEALLLAQGIRTLVVWECSLKPSVRTETLERLYIEIINPNN